VVADGFLVSMEKDGNYALQFKTYSGKAGGNAMCIQAIVTTNGKTIDCWQFLGHMNDANQ
jgi:hypothetical protein